MKPFFVYMLRCADRSYYVGHTDELERRIAQHQAGEIPGYTHERRPVELVWSQETATRSEAIEAEQRIKGWARAKKEALIRGDWLAVQKHAWGTRNPLPDHLKDDPSIPQGERVLASIPQPERSVNGESALENERKHLALPEARHLAHPEARHPARPDVKHPARPEVKHPVRPEVSKGIDAKNEASIPQGERGVGESMSPSDRALLTGVLDRQRRAIAKTITLLESSRADHRQRADALLNALIPHTGHAMRIGISGVPGVGKSTFIEALGLDLIAKGHRVAVLTIDPSSSLSGGSILGDKTRMEKLSVRDAAYIRPSPASGALGGVAEKTREAMLVCEAAGYDVVIVETVGVGQSETAVASMTDMFVLLQLPNAGDDLQALKKGVMELADLVVINKADVDPDAATRAEATITSAMRIFSSHGKPGQWSPKVMRISALKAQGIAEFWQQVQQFHEQRHASGEFDMRRKKQAHSWMWDIIQARLQADFRQHPAVREALHHTLREVTDSRIAPSVAARKLLDLFERS